MIASEALEAGRAMENGFISPERTTLIASTHRIYAVAEKAQLTDGRHDASTLLATAETLARQPILRDFRQIAEDADSVVNAVLLGAVAASGRLPFEASHLEAAIRDGGVAVAANLEGFAPRTGSGAGSRRGRAAERAGNGAARSSRRAECAGIPVVGRPPRSLVRDGRPDAPCRPRQGGGFPGPGLRHPVSRPPRSGAPRHAGGRGPGGGRGLAGLSLSRGLANWMAYDDIIRVAELKTRPDRFERIRGETRAGAGEPLRVTDYFRPGTEELAAVLPSFLAKPLLAWVKGAPGRAERRLGLRIRATSVPGYLLLRLLARLRVLRRFGHRFGEERAAIERWLDAAGRAAARDVTLALEITECAALIRGYGETHERGRKRFERIFARVVTPGLGSGGQVAELRLAIEAARRAANADPEGEALGRLIEAGAAE